MNANTNCQSCGMPMKKMFGEEGQIQMEKRIRNIEVTVIKPEHLLLKVQFLFSGIL